MPEDCVQALNDEYHHGQRRIRGGRFEVRIARYMAALSTARCKPVLSVFYRRLRQRGKPAKVALTAVMRKLLCLAQRLLQNPNFALAPQHSC